MPISLAPVLMLPYIGPAAAAVPAAASTVALPALAASVRLEHPCLPMLLEVPPAQAWAFSELQQLAATP